MSYQILCILSHVRSGSTLFGQLLGAHSKVTLAGELQWLRAYVLNDRRLYNPPHELLCACGKAVNDCEFWHAVSENVARPLADLQLMPRFFEWAGPPAEPLGLHERVPRRIMEFYPSLYRPRLVQSFFGGRQVAADNMEVFDAIFKYTNARYLVDTSKRNFRFRTIYEWYPHKLKVIVLHRDYRAVVYSQMKRGYTLEQSARSWVQTANQIDVFTDGIPRTNVAQLKYEDLCAEPTSELQRMCQFLGLEFETSMLRRPTHGVHDIGGSPSKLESGRREIRLDTEYLKEFSNAQLTKIKRLVGSKGELYD